MNPEYTLTIPTANGVAMTAEIKRNITDIITADFLSRLSASKSLKSSETSDKTFEILDPLLLPSRIIPNTLSSSFDFNLLLIALQASSKFLPIRISMIALLTSS